MYVLRFHRQFKEIGAKPNAEEPGFLLTASLAENLFGDAPGVLRPRGGPLDGRVPRGAESLEEHKVLPAGAHAEPHWMFARRTRAVAAVAVAVALVLLPEHESDVAPQPLRHLALHHPEDSHGGKVQPVVRGGPDIGRFETAMPETNNFASTSCKNTISGIADIERIECDLEMSLA